ncbi:MAG: glycosyltransferase [Planctomycetota bacterium]
MKKQNEPKPGERILIISPAKDEGEFINQTIHSMAWQTLRPALWVIVNDGSSDDTGKLADEAAEEYDWIKVVHRPAGTKRRVGPGVIEAFYAGLESVDMKEFDFVVKLDADIHLPHFYFAELIERFNQNPRLGTISGKCYMPVAGELVYERTGDDFTHGTAKLYRRECFEEIGGFVREVMWDGIDCHKCRMLGWEAKSIEDPQLSIIHLRQMGSSHKNILHGRRRWGRGQYFMGTHFAYALAIAVYRMAERPWVLGGLNILFGYVWAMITRYPRFQDKEFRKFLRKWQWQKLWSMVLPGSLGKSSAASPQGGSPAAPSFGAKAAGPSA